MPISFIWQEMILGYESIVDSTGSIRSVNESFSRFCESFGLTLCTGSTDSLKQRVDSKEQLIHDSDIATMRLCYVSLHWKYSEQRVHTVDCSDKTSWSELKFEQRNRVYDTFPKQPISCQILCIHDYILYSYVFFK